METLPELLLGGAILLTVLLAIGWLALGRHRPVLRRLVAFSNTLLLTGAVLLLLTAAYQSLVQLHRGDEYERYVALSRITGPYWFAYWGALLCKGGLPQLLWLKKLRHSLGAAIALVPWLLVDYWLPLLYSRLHHDYLPSSWIMLPDYQGLAVVGLGCLVVALVIGLLVRRW